MENGISIVVLTRNRLESLKRCIKSIDDNTTVEHEIIIVNNASEDGTKQYLHTLDQKYNEHVDFKRPDCCDSHYRQSLKIVMRGVTMEKNYGVAGGRNQGFDLCRGEYILQCDDDVIFHKGWDTTALKYITEGDNVGIVGVQGSLIKTWLEYEVFQHNNTYVDVCTGFFFMMKNIGLRYDTSNYELFWEEDSAICLDYKALGYKIRVMPMVCTHASQRTEPVDWNRHNSHREYLKNKWKDNLAVLRLGGN